MARKIKRDRIRISFYVLIAILALTVIYGIYSFILNFYPSLLTQTNTSSPSQIKNNLTGLPVGIIYEDYYTYNEEWGAEIPKSNREFAYIAITPQEQELGFMNQTSYGPGNMLFLFNSNTTHCFWNKNTGTNLTLYQIDWYSQSQQPFNIYWAEEGNPPASNKFGVVKLITTLQAYNTTPECTVSDAVIESTRPQPLSVGDFISVVYNDK